MGTTRARPLGPTGRRVAENVKQLRKVTVRELSAQLAEVGRPIAPSGITKIEQGERAVDVDDLVALALVLDATPNRLLIGASNEREQLIDLEPDFAATFEAAWQWVDGLLPAAHDVEEVLRGRHPSQSS